MILFTWLSWVCWWRKGVDIHSVPVGIICFDWNSVFSMRLLILYIWICCCDGLNRQVQKLLEWNIAYRTGIETSKGTLGSPIEIHIRLLVECDICHFSWYVKIVSQSVHVNHVQLVAFECSIKILSLFRSASCCSGRKKSEW